MVISCRREAETVVISVEDFGHGIPVEEQSLVFEKYYRSPKSRTGAPGTGLGLSIARSIARAHGGGLWVTSQPGQGSVFHFALPAVKEPA